MWVYGALIPVKVELLVELQNLGWKTAWIMLA
jgi:hypothetical protein